MMCWLAAGCQHQPPPIIFFSPERCKCKFWFWFKSKVHSHKVGFSAADTGSHRSEITVEKQEDLQFVPSRGQCTAPKADASVPVLKL